MLSFKMLTSGKKVSVQIARYCEIEREEAGGRGGGGVGWGC